MGRLGEEIDIFIINYSGQSLHEFVDLLWLRVEGEHQSGLRR